MKAGLLVLACGAVLLGCADSGPAELGGVAEAAPSADFPWVEPVASEGEIVDQLPAHVVQTADSEAIVMAPLKARVVSVMVRPGDTVAKGDPIAKVVMPELEEAVAALRGADGEMTVLEARQARLSKLQAEGLAVRKDVVALEIEIARADSVRKTAKAVLAGAGLRSGGVQTLRSPIDGVIVEADVRLGEVRHPDDGPLAIVRAPTGSRVSAVLPRKPDPAMRTDFVRDGQEPVPLRLVTSISDASGFGYQAWFELVSDDGSGSGLEASARGRVSFRLPSAGPSWRLPETAVGRDDTGAFAIVADDGSRRRRIPLEVLRVASGEAYVRGDLSATSRVATDPERALEGSQ